jgi:hypothetical protein
MSARQSSTLLVGQFKNGGKEWHRAGEPEEVKVHDFVDKELGRATPYGVYDIAADQGWVSVGTDHDTAAFAVQTIRRWWSMMGKPRYPKAKELTITADGGGSNGHRVRLWKLELSKLASETGLTIHLISDLAQHPLRSASRCGFVTAAARIRRGRIERRS